MAYVSVAEWRPEQVTEWLKGLDNSIVSYIHWFSNNEVNGQQLLNLSPDELTHLGVYKLGHQELILEAVQHLRNFHYELDRENLQLLSLKLSCAAHSLHSEIRDQAESSSVPTQIMADVANVIHHVKPLVSWLDRPPFEGQIQYTECKSQLLSLCLEMATCAQRDRFAEKPVAKIRTCSSKLAKLADYIIQEITDPMILQPATLDLATIKKKVGEDLDFFLVPSFHGIHQIGDMKLSSPAHQSGKIQQGDEIVQVNYQTVVGWSRKKVLALFEESPNDLLLTLKRRPKHVKMYGQIYMKPYRLPSRKRASPYSRWNDNLPSPRPELLTIPHFDIARTINLSKKVENNQNLSLEPSGTSSSSDEEFGQPSDSQTSASMRLYLPKPRTSIQRRFTLSGPPQPSAQSEQFWRELQLERSWRSNQNNSQIKNSSIQNVRSEQENIDEMFHLRVKSASFGNSIASASSRSTTCVSFTKDNLGSVKLDLTKFEPLKSDLVLCDKTFREERDKTVCDTSLKSSAAEIFSDKITSESEGNNYVCFSETSNLSISELNKLKRDAFFKNMDCSDTCNELVVENKRDNVKRVVENLNAEILKIKTDKVVNEGPKNPGKVMELVENFEKKESVPVPFKSKINFSQIEKPSLLKSLKEKGRLDKSSSTPTYDSTNYELFESNKSFLEDSKINQESFRSFSKSISQKQALSFMCKEPPTTEENGNKKGVQNVNYEDLEKVNHEKLVQKTNIFENEKKSNGKDIHHDTRNNNLEQNHSYSKNEFVKESLIQSSHYRKEDLGPLNKCPEPDLINFIPNKKNPQSDFLGEESTFFPSSLPTLNRNEESNKPIPAQRKSKLQPEKMNQPGTNSNLFPLPPKPRSKIFSLSLEKSSVSNASTSDKTPPEPPPRPENTFSKLSSPKVTGKKNFEDNFLGGDFIGEPAKLTEFQQKSLHGVTSKLETFDVTTFVSNDLKSFSSVASPPIRKSPKPASISNCGATTSMLSTEKEKPKTSASTLESLKAMLTLGRKSTNIISPRSVRKKNVILAKKRNVSAKEITIFENSGYLWHRNRKGSTIASWTRYFFILQGSNFYGFKSKDSLKADLFIHLPGFTCAVAEEVKSKEFSFKIYHTGTIFYFAADSEEDLQQWLDCVNLAISFQDDKFVPEVVNFSQTDSDTTDTEAEPETCFPTSPKMKKVLGSSPMPKPARSHQNLASESKKTQDNQKRFGSLKKLSSQKTSGTTYFSGSNESSEVASLDRKYLRFLGQKNSPTPVPTSRFRSYRRMQPGPSVLSKDKSKIKTRNFDDNDEDNSSQINSLDPSRLTKKPLYSSNPSLIHPDMADYRITQERLAEFRRLRNQSGVHEFNRLMALDQLLYNRRENYRSSRNRPAEVSGLMTLEQFLLIQEEERQRSLRITERPITPADTPSREATVPEPDRYKSVVQNKIVVNSGQNRGSPSNSNVLDTNKKEFEKPHVTPRSKVLSTTTQVKNINLNEPFAIPHSSYTTSQETPTKLMAFEVSKGEERQFLPKVDHLKTVKCHHTVNNTTDDHQLIEYPPAFEPETYTLQHMLKNRQKRDSEQNK